ncbi:hypothetical protein Tco_1476112 [Tanacetum coccineum]
MPTATTGRCLVVAVAQQRKRNAAAAVELLHTPNDLVSNENENSEFTNSLLLGQKKKKEKWERSGTRDLLNYAYFGIYLYPYFIFSCLSDMSNSDELRHTDNTTLVPPRLPDTLPQVYHRRRPTLGLLILPSVSPFPPTIRRTARISIPPIEPNLAERARISAINLDDYQLDPLTPPPSPSSPFTMAAYQRMIAETDPTQREEALTETGQNLVPVPETTLTVCTTRLRGQLHSILEDIDRYLNAYLEELEAFMTLCDVKPRVEESLLETLSMDELITQLR